MTLPRRKPASKRPATMSIRPTSTEISMVISGYLARKRANIGASVNFATGGGSVRRRCPAGRSRNALTDSIAASNPSSSGRNWRSMRSPASVRATLRVVRLSRRTPSRSSSDRTVWLKVAVESPSRLAALVKLASSATATKALSSANCVPRMGSAPWATAGYQPALPLRSVRAPPARVDIPSGALLRAFVFTGSREAHHHVIIWTA